MVSDLIDELRQMADGQATYRDARAVMLQAADAITELRGALSVASVDYRNLSDENDKLRELIEAILQCACEIKQDKGCDACPMYNEGGSWTDGDACLLRPTLRELGVEVDG